MGGGFTSVVQVCVVLFRLLPVFNHMTLKFKRRSHNVNILTTTTNNALSHSCDLQKLFNTLQTV